MPLLQLLLRQGAPTSDVLGERAQIGLACAAGRVNVGGLDSWLALVEQPPRTDEAPETAGHSQDVPERFARALEKTREPRGATNARVLWTSPVVLRRSVLRVSSMALSSSCPSESAPRLRSRPHQPASHAHRHRRRQGGQRLVRPEGARASSRVARTGGFVGLRWAGSRRHGEGSMPDRARRRRDEVT